MKKIMIVEDDRKIVKELEDLLMNSGYQAVDLKDFANAKEEILKADDFITKPYNPTILLLRIVNIFKQTLIFCFFVVPFFGRASEVRSEYGHLQNI